MNRFQIILILCGLFLPTFLCQPARADQFKGKALRVDARVEDLLNNSDQTHLPVLPAGETFQIELFVDGARSLRTQGYTIAFDNTGNRFGDYFTIQRINGILPQNGLPGPTSISSGADKPVIISSNDYLATITLAVKRALPSGHTLAFDALRTRIIDASALTADTLNVRRAVITFGAPDYDLFLDLDTTPGNQGLTKTYGIKSGSEIAIQIFGNRIRFMSGFILRFEYDATQLAFDSFETGAILPNVQTLAPIISQLDSPFADVEVTAASFGGSANLETGLLGALKFRPRDAFKRTDVRMTLAEIRRSGQFHPFLAPLQVELIGLNTDFDNDGFVGFRDFVLFAERFGAKFGEPLYDNRFDLVPDGAVNFADFVVFSESLTLLKITVLD